LPFSSGLFPWALSIGTSRLGEACALERGIHAASALDGIEIQTIPKLFLALAPGKGITMKKIW
jgi:hypothetical protein